MAKLLLVVFNAGEASLGMGFASELGLPYDILCMSGLPEEDLGAETVISAGLVELPPADGLARGIALVAKGYTHIGSVSTMLSKDVLARVAGLLDIGMLTDVVSVESPVLFKRPVVAGSVLATVEVLETPIAITFRPAGFGKPARNGVSAVESIELDCTSHVKRETVSARKGSRPDLTQAKVVVSGGRPLRDAETFEKVIGGLADALGGAVGATRAAVDSGIAPNELQVGQTGKIVAPDLYIAAGISGSTQHMAGIKDSKTIVAINKDPDAPIFEVADFGLVADLFEAVPAIEQAIRRR